MKKNKVGFFTYCIALPCVILIYVMAFFLYIYYKIFRPNTEWDQLTGNRVKKKKRN